MESYLESEKNCEREIMREKNRKMMGGCYDGGGVLLENFIQNEYSVVIVSPSIPDFVDFVDHTDCCDLSFHAIRLNSNCGF